MLATACVNGGGPVAVRLACAPAVERELWSQVANRSVEIMKIRDQNLAVLISNHLVKALPNAIGNAVGRVLARVLKG